MELDKYYNKEVFMGARLPLLHGDGQILQQGGIMGARLQLLNTAGKVLQQGGIYGC